MGRKWKRSSLSLTTGFILSAVLSAQGLAQHPAIQLIDIYGNSIKDVVDASKTAYEANETETEYSELFDTNSTPLALTVKTRDGDNETIYKGTPVSFEKTCVTCHEDVVMDVRASHHGAVGLHDMGWMDNRETYGDDTGTKDFVTNQVLKMRYFRSKSHYGGW